MEMGRWYPSIMDQLVSLELSSVNQTTDSPNGQPGADSGPVHNALACSEPDGEMAGSMAGSGPCTSRPVGIVLDT